MKKWERIQANIYKSLDVNKKYRVDLYYGRDAKGKIIKTSKVIYGSLNDAKKALKIHEAQRIRNELTMPTKITIKKLIEDWNRNVNELRNMETTQVFNRNLQKHILEYFGDMKICLMTTNTILEYFSYLKKVKGLSNLTINKHRTHLYTLFEYMVENDDYYGISKNIIKKTKALSVADRKYELLDPETAKTLLTSLRLSNKLDLEIAVNLGLYCGCRREETCALKWESVDLTKKIIVIHEVRTTAGNKVVEMKHTKNKSIRVVGIPEWFVMVLGIANERRMENKKIYGDAYYKGESYVFCHDDGTPWHPNSLSREYRNYLIQNGFPVIRYHDLRHTNLSLLLSKMSAVDVAKLGGHNKVSTTTDIYGHSFNDAVEKGRDVMNQLILMC